jgi:hypothetical protein
MITINYENDDFLFKRIVLEQMNYMAVNVFIIKPGVKIYTKTIKDPKKKFNCRRLLELNEIKKGNQIVNPAGKKNYGIFIKPAENGLDSVVFVYAQPSIKQTLSILIHEFLHASVCITDLLGIKIDNPTDTEPQAYLQSYLFECFYDDVIRMIDTWRIK